MEREEDLGGAAAAVSRVPKTAGPIPWEDPELPRLGAFYRTLRELLFNPQDFFQRLGPGGWAEALTFGLIAGTAGLLACLFWGALLYAAVSRPLGEALGGFPVSGLGLGITILLMLLSPVIALSNQGYGAFCLWLAASLAGVGREFTPAWRIFSYAQGAMVAAFLPLLGIPLSGLWVLVLVYLGVQAVFQTSGWRTLGVLVLFLFLQFVLLALLTGTLLASLALLGFWLFRR
jgi:hypothetical protein